MAKVIDGTNIGRSIQDAYDLLSDADDLEIYETELAKQVREHKLRNFKPVFVLRKSNGTETRKEL